MTTLQSQIKQMSLEYIKSFTAKSVKEFCSDGKTESLIKTHVGMLKQELPKESMDEIRKKVNEIVHNSKSGQVVEIVDSCAFAIHLGVYCKYKPESHSTEYNYPED
jgi:hypothetical protein